MSIGGAPPALTRVGGIPPPHLPPRHLTPPHLPPRHVRQEAEHEDDGGGAVGPLDVAQGEEPAGKEGVGQSGSEGNGTHSIKAQPVSQQYGMAVMELR